MKDTRNKDFEIDEHCLLRFEKVDGVEVLRKYELIGGCYVMSVPYDDRAMSAGDQKDSILKALDNIEQVADDCSEGNIPPSDYDIIISNIKVIRDILKSYNLDVI